MSCSPSARTIICNEIFDENSLPSEEEVHEYAVKIGIDPESEPHLLHFARDGLMQALPPGWKPCFDEELQSWYYFNFKTGESRWEHPLDDVYRTLVVKGRSESISSAGEEDSKTSLKEELRSYEEGVGSEVSGSCASAKSTGVTYLKKSSLQLAPLKKSPMSPLVSNSGTTVVPTGRLQSSTPAGWREGREPLRVDLRSPSDRETAPLIRNRIDIDKMGTSTLLGRPSPGPIDIDKMSVAPLLGESGDNVSSGTSAARRSALPPSAQEKHPRSLVQQGRSELKLSGGGSVFLKSHQQQQHQSVSATTPTSEDTPSAGACMGASGDEGSTRRGILREQRSTSTETRDDSGRSSTPLWEMNPAHMTGEQKQQWRRQELEDEQRKSVRFNLLDSENLDIRFQTSDNENDDEIGSDEKYRDEKIVTNGDQEWDSEDENECDCELETVETKKVTVSLPDVRQSALELKEDGQEDASINEESDSEIDECKRRVQEEHMYIAPESVPSKNALLKETCEGQSVPDQGESKKDDLHPVTWMAEVSVVQSSVIYDQLPKIHEHNQMSDDKCITQNEGEVNGEGEEEEEGEKEEVEVVEGEEDEEEEEEEAEFVSGKDVIRSAETDSKENTTDSKGTENIKKKTITVQEKISSEKTDISEIKGVVQTDEARESDEDEVAEVVVDENVSEKGESDISAQHKKVPFIPGHKVSIQKTLVQSDTMTESDDMASAKETVQQEDEVVKPLTESAQKCNCELKNQTVVKSDGGLRNELRTTKSECISKSDPLSQSDVGTKSAGASKSDGISKSDPLTKSSDGLSVSERITRSEETDEVVPAIPGTTQNTSGKGMKKDEQVPVLSERTTQSEASEDTGHSDESSHEERDEPVPSARSVPADGAASTSLVNAVLIEEADGHSPGALALSKSDTAETSPERDMANRTASTSDSSPLQKLSQQHQKAEDTVACTTATTTTSSGTSIDVDFRKEANLRLKERLQEMERQAAETIRLHREKLQAQVEAAVQELEIEQEQRLSELAERLALKEEVERERFLSESQCRLDAIRINTEQQERILRAECERRLQQVSADCRTQLEATEQVHAKELARIKAEDEAQLQEARARLAATQADLQLQIDAVIAEKEALLVKHKKEVADLQNEVRPEQLSEEHKEALDKLRTEQEIALKRIKSQFQHEEEAVRQEHAERIEELKARLELERQRLWDRGLVDDNESARQQLVETSRVFEKLRCEKRLLEDKYRTLKEKYLRLKTDVKISMERRKRREAAVNTGGHTTGNGTGSESERIVPHRTSSTTVPLIERSKAAVINMEKLRAAPDRQRPAAAMTDDPVIANRGSNPTTQQQQQQAMTSKLLTGEAKETFDVDGSNTGDTNVNNNNNNNNDINSTTGNNDTNGNTSNIKRRRQLFGRQHTTPPARLASNNANNNLVGSIDRGCDITDDEGRSCSPVENLRRQLQTLEDLEDQFPAASLADTYLRYPFSDTGKFGSSELEFFRHRIHLERDSVRRAKDFLRMQRDSFQARQNELRQRQERRGSSARSMLDQLYKEERELTDMEVSLHRTKSLLGEKIIRLRHLEQSLQRAGETVPNGQVDNTHATSSGGGGTTLSDLSSHSGSSGFSSTELATETQGQINSVTRRGGHYQESTEIIQSLENLNTEIREIWDVLNKQQKDGNIGSSSLPPPPTLAYNWVPPTTVPVAVPTYHHPAPHTHLRRYGLPSTSTQSGLDRSLVERTRSLRDWLRQARIDGNAARTMSAGQVQTHVTTAAI